MCDPLVKAKEYYVESSHVLREIKNSINAQGYWDGDYGNWDEIIAVCNLESMLSLGVTFDEHWIVKHDGAVFEMSPDKTVEYLNSHMIVLKDKCLFGEDLWDLFRLMNMIENFNLEGRFKNYKRFSDFCKKTIKNLDFHIDTRWDGPGVIAVAYEYAYRNRMKCKDKLLDMLVSQKKENDMWGEGSPQFQVWHTAQVLKAMAIAGKLENIQQSLDKIYECTLSKEFDSDYFLNCYYCVYAALAYIYCNRTDDAHFTSIIQSKILPRINQHDLDRGGSSMIAELFSFYYLYGETTRSFPFINFIVRANEIELAISENQSLKKLNQELQGKIKEQSNYFFIRKSIIKVIKWILLALLSAIITGLVSYIIRANLGG